ncbi:uncharacterized protein LOC130137075 [Syzygium oleosum]|uniref:uncharacterized protein LOC130137075 n=1 Tax=Syzygium oleosum TaxID=219896 RepID=UPI0024B8BAC1|nr:uncharacterized protein LOC130137075 [Syzygium oleosum]
MKQERPEDYLHDWYKKSSYLNSYQFMMQPIRSSKFWEPTNHEGPLPLPLKKQIGRPKKNRRIQEGEASSQRMSKTRVKIKCSYCHKEGHNKKGCQLKRQREQEVVARADRGSRTTPTEEVALGPTEGPTKGPVVGPSAGTSTGRTATTTTESTIEQTRKKYPVRRRPTAQVAQGQGAPQVAPSQVAQSDAPQRTRGVLGKRIRQYGYGIYTDERTGMTIFNPGRSSEVLISQGGPTQESMAQPKKSTKKKKTAIVGAGCTCWLKLWVLHLPALANTSTGVRTRCTSIALVQLWLLVHPVAPTQLSVQLWVLVCLLPPTLV